MASQNNSPPRKCQKVYDDKNTEEGPSSSTKPMIDGTYDSPSDDSEASPSKSMSSTPNQELSPIALATKYQPNLQKDCVEDTHPKTGTIHPKLSSFEDEHPNNAPLSQYDIMIQVNEIHDDGHFLDEIS